MTDYMYWGNDNLDRYGSYRGYYGDPFEGTVARKRNYVYKPYEE
jgi:hypothetical protein